MAKCKKSAIKAANLAPQTESLRQRRAEVRTPSGDPIKTTGLSH